MKGEKFFREMELLSMELTMQEKLKLISFFELLLDNEVSKPLGEMDSKSVDAYIKILMNLQDMHIELSSEFIDEQVRKIFHKEEKTALPEAVKTTKKYFNKKKVWLVAACIAILVALFSIVSVASDWNVFDFLSEKFGSVHSAPIEEGVDFNGITITNHGKGTKYKTIEDALKAEKIDVLYPSVLPDGITITNITTFIEDSEKVVTFNFSNFDINLTVFYNRELSTEAKTNSTKTQEINSILCYICEMPDVSLYQIEFEYKGNLYSFNHTNKEELIKIIENLKEIDYEN